MNNTYFLGIVENGKFQQLLPAPDPQTPTKFTSMQLVEARSPNELDLSQYEGMAIMISGHGETGWVYSAQVIDKAGLILTQVVRHVFGKA